MNPPTFPREVQTPRGKPSPTHPYFSEGAQLPREKEQSGSPLLTRALADKKKGISRLDGRNLREHPHQHYHRNHTEPTHKI